MASTPNTHQAALETLVVAQLAAIRKREAELQIHLQQSSGLEPVNVAAELWQLQTSADRLNRMMDAMNFRVTHAAFAA
jgi:3,4-dihydroxy-2-butanone 4-phosphate synthase